MAGLDAHWHFTGCPEGRAAEDGELEAGAVGSTAPALDPAAATTLWTVTPTPPDDPRVCATTRPKGPVYSSAPNPAEAF